MAQVTTTENALMSAAEGAVKRPWVATETDLVPADLRDIARAVEAGLAHNTFWFLAERWLRMRALEQLSEELKGNRRSIIEARWFCPHLPASLQWYLLEKFMAGDDLGSCARELVKQCRGARPPLTAFQRPVLQIERTQHGWHAVSWFLEEVDFGADDGVRVEVLL